MHIKKVAVVGAGTMGASIAVALIGHGFPVLLKDVNQSTLEAGMARIDRLLESRVKKGLPPTDAQKQKAALLPTTDFSRFGEVDLAIEAASENIETKRAIFADLEKHCSQQAILSSNTSGLSITRIGGFTSTPERVIGLHFFNPAHLMKLVEVIPGLDTSEETVSAALSFGHALGKLAVRVEECASFLVNRLLGRYMNESLWCLQEGIASVEEIDSAACRYVMPIGPLALRDMNGADVGLAVACFNYQEYGERFRPAPVLEEMVKKGLLGQKSGHGFYLYDPQTHRRCGVNPDIESLLSGFFAGSQRRGEPFAVERLFLPMINESFLSLSEKVCAAGDLDPALMAGLGMRKGPLALASEIGLADCLNMMEKMFAKHGERFRPAPLLKRYVWGGRKSVI